jgi:hypothetical protein
LFCGCGCDGGAGLKYQDLIVETPEVQKALSRLPEDTLIARDRRFKRALDISFKRKPLPAEHQEKIDVFDVRVVMLSCTRFFFCCSHVLRNGSSTWRRR